MYPYSTYIRHFPKWKLLFIRFRCITPSVSLWARFFSENKLFVCNVASPSKKKKNEAYVSRFSKAIYQDEILVANESRSIERKKNAYFCMEPLWDTLLFYAKHTKKCNYILRMLYTLCRSDDALFRGYINVFFSSFSIYWKKFHLIWNNLNFILNRLNLGTLFSGKEFNVVFVIKKKQNSKFKTWKQIKK